MSMDAEVMERRSTLRKKEGFEKWLDEPMTRMGLSMIPAGEHADGLKLLLQSAYNSGFGCGQGEAMGNIVEALMKKRPTEDR